MCIVYLKQGYQNKSVEEASCPLWHIKLCFVKQKSVSLDLHVPRFLRAIKFGFQVTGQGLELPFCELRKKVSDPTEGTIGRRREAISIKFPDSHQQQPSSVSSFIPVAP